MSTCIPIFSLAVLLLPVCGWRKGSLNWKHGNNDLSDKPKSSHFVYNRLNPISAVLLASNRPTTSTDTLSRSYERRASIERTAKKNAIRRSASVAQFRRDDSDAAPLAATSLRTSSQGESQVLRQLIGNQLLIGFPIWSGGFGAQALANDLQLDDGFAKGLGVCGGLALVALGLFIEKSDARIFTDLNIATKLTTLRLFGTKALPITALIVSVALAALIGVVEETIFRGGMLPSIAQWSVDNGLANTLEEGEPLGLIVSSLLFGLGHISPTISLDTLVLFGLQSLTGLTFGSLFVLTGNLATPIIAHFLYDLYTLYESHLSVTDQIAYAEYAHTPESSSETQEIERELAGHAFVDEARQAYFLMDTNRDGKISPAELRAAFFSMGLKLDETKFQEAFERADLDKSGEIDFEEFLTFVSNNEEGAIESATRIKQSLLGVRI